MCVCVCVSECDIVGDMTDVSDNELCSNITLYECQRTELAHSSTIFIQLSLF